MKINREEKSYKLYHEIESNINYNIFLMKDFNNFRSEYILNTIYI